MDTNILIGLTFLAIGIEHLTPLPAWIVGILAILVGLLILVI